jgi:hypothetical protein
MSDLTKEIDALCRELENDPHYRMTWQANIALFCYDALARAGIAGKIIHEACNKGADEFLRTLCLVGK